MAWTALSFAYGSKLTSAKMTQMVDNFTAMGSGSPGAPKISRLAFEPYTVGSCNILNVSNSGGTFANTYTPVIDLVIPRAGSISVKFTMASIGSGGAQLYQNSSAVGAVRIVNNQTSTYIETVSSLTAGDRLKVCAYNASSNTATNISSMGLFVSNPLVPTSIL